MEKSLSILDKFGIKSKSIVSFSCENSKLALYTADLLESRYNTILDDTIIIWCFQPTSFILNDEKTPSAIVEIPVKHLLNEKELNNLSENDLLQELRLKIEDIVKDHWNIVFADTFGTYNLKMNF